MTMSLDAKVLRAMAGLARKPEDAGGNSPTTRLHLRPLPDLPPAEPDGPWRPQGSVVEVCDGRAYLRVEVPETCDQPVLFDRDTARMPLSDQTVNVDGTTMRVHGFEKVLDVPRPDGVPYPDCEGLRPDTAARVAFEINPAVLANVAAAIKRLGVKRVQVLLPSQRGGPIGMRGEMKNGRLVESTILSESLFGASSEDMPQDGPVAGHLAGPRALGHTQQDELPALPEPAVVLCGEPAAFVWSDGEHHRYVCLRHQDSEGHGEGWRRAAFAPLSVEFARTCEVEQYVVADDAA